MNQRGRAYQLVDIRAAYQALQTSNPHLGIPAVLSADGRAQEMGARECVDPLNLHIHFG